MKTIDPGVRRTPEEIDALPYPHHCDNCGETIRHRLHYRTHDCD